MPSKRDDHTWSPSNSPSKGKPSRGVGGHDAKRAKLECPFGIASSCHANTVSGKQAATLSRWLTIIEQHGETFLNKEQPSIGGYEHGKHATSQCCYACFRVSQMYFLLWGTLRFAPIWFALKRALFFSSCSLRCSRCSRCNCTAGPGTEHQKVRGRAGCHRSHVACGRGCRFTQGATDARASTRGSAVRHRQPALHFLWSIGKRHGKV
jgi:hypothetical protein